MVARMRRRWGIVRGAVPPVLVAVLLGGCLQLETHIRVHTDGSATITERLQFSERLLDMASQAGPGLDLASLLTKQAALKRMSQMGKGATLVSHEVRDGEQGAKESLAVFTIPDISDFTYVSPYLALPNYGKHYGIKCTMFPLYKSTWWGRSAGQMAVTFAPTSKEPDRGKPGEPPPQNPLALQAFRDLQSLFRDLMKELKIKLTFEAYSPIRVHDSYGYRGARELTHTYDLIDFSDRNLDRYGTSFLDNQEVMLELLRLQVAGPNVMENTKGHASNPTLPVFHPTGTPEIYFKPSRALFDRHFQGKTLDGSGDYPASRPANFDEIGFKEKPEKKPGG